MRYAITWAFNIQEYQLAGGPSWILDRYDINAKPGGATGAERRLMLKNLLEDRFKRQVHSEIREQTQYALRIAKGGPKLKQANETTCPAESDRKVTPCGRLAWSRTELAGRRVPMRMLIYVLSQALGRTVVDQTGLQEPFDMTLRWTPDAGVGQSSTDAPPSLFTALREQMGLKLQAGKGATEMIVIDRLERPTGN